MDIVIILKINFKNLFQIIESKKQSLDTVEFLAKNKKTIYIVKLKLLRLIFQNILKNLKLFKISDHE